MIDFAKRPDKLPAAWLERLLSSGIEQDLTNDRRIALAHYIQEAQQAAGVGPQTPSTPLPEMLADSLIAAAPATPDGPLYVRL